MRHPLMAALGICLVALLPTARAMPEDAPPPATRAYSSGDEGHGVLVELPREWKVERMEVPGFEMFLRLQSASVDGYFSLNVQRLPGIRNDRGQAFGDRITMPKTCKTDAVGEVQLDPMPHLILDYEDFGETLRHVWIPRVIRRLGLTVNVACRKTSWPAVRDAAFKAAASMTSDFDEFPARPNGYRASFRDGYEYLVNPAVKDKDVDSLHATIVEQEKRFALLHGAVPKPESNPIVVVVAPDKAAVAALAGDVPSPAGYAANYAEGRVFAMPLKKDDAVGRAELADRLVVIFHTQSYGCGLPFWLSDGERRIAALEAKLRKPLPTVPAESVTEFATSLKPFEELVTKPPADAVAQSAAYVALFRAGPKLYRDAFAAFLQELAATGDWEAAQKKHLFALDQEKLRVDAQAYVSKELKPVKSK